MRFEWDKSKNKRNIQNHKIDFEDVHAVFDGPMIIQLDNRQDYGEDRWIGAGFLHDIIIIIVFTEPDDDVIRFVSARRANRHEQKRFAAELKNRLG